MKVRALEWIARVNFHFEFGNRIINNFRSMLMVLILVKMWEIPNRFYPGIVIGYALGCWFLGWAADRIGLHEYLQTEYYKRQGEMTKDIKGLKGFK
jgi:hypothetical protein